MSADTDLYVEVQNECERAVIESLSDCGCETCIVREVLDAARPYFRALAQAEGQL